MTWKTEAKLIAAPGCYPTSVLVPLVPLLAAGVWEGHIALAPQGDGGFGYDPVFVPAGSTQTLAQWSAADKNAVSHRAQALQQLLQRWPGSLR
jgi:XTP/dITP diphosphohydrolase